MSLVGFKAENHTQQVGKRGPRDDVDDRGTDPAYFDQLDQRFGFTVDVAAAEHNAKCERWYGLDDDGLAQSWADEVVWCNPPYSNIRPWVAKAWHEWRGLDGVSGSSGTRPPKKIVMLLPANRVEQAWWQDLIEPFRDQPDMPLRVEFLRGRMRFDRPSAVIGPKGDRPPFGCCLVIWDNAFVSTAPAGGAS